MTGMQKKNGRPTQPGSHSTSNQRSRRKPKSILYRLIEKCKPLKWQRIALVLLALILVFTLARNTAGDDEQMEGQRQGAGNNETVPQKPAPPFYIFKGSDGIPVDIAGMTDAWAAEAGIIKRYIITDEERCELAAVVTAEAVGEPFAGKVAVAQCILQACEDDGIRPDEALKKYEYSARRPDPTDEALEAVAAVFDFGYVVTGEPIKYFYAPAICQSDWHESQVYVLTINNHKFFKEAKKEE